MELRRRVPRPLTLSIVTYHHIADDDPAYRYDPGVADATPAQFRRQIEMLARYGTPIGIDELIRAIDGEPLPENPVMITFDDGYRSCHDVALPILREVGVPAVFFIATSFVTERKLYWWERIALMLRQTKRDVAALRYPQPVEIAVEDPRAHCKLTRVVKDTPALELDPFLDELSRALDVDWSPARERAYADELIMTWDHVRALAAAGMGVESHGRRHRVLQTLDDGALADELAGSRAELEAQIARPVRAVAYPVGRRVADEHRIREALGAAGYTIGMSNNSGVNRLWRARLDPFDVRRLSTDREMSDAMFLTQVAVPRLAYMSRHNR